MDEYGFASCGRNGERLTEVRTMLRFVRPRTADELYGYVRGVLGFDVPRVVMQYGMSAPFDYLKHSYFEDSVPRDCIIWANRGGGKTQLGAIATLLDLIFKPGIQIRILGGSLDQSSKMYGYLRLILERDEFRDVVAGKITGRKIILANGSAVEVLAQSEQSVRGQRVQKLRCDEVDLFSEDIWKAAQFVTQSAWCGEVFVPGVIEAFSTMHRPFGLMQRLVEESAKQGRKVFRWGILDVLTRCPAARDCEKCLLLPECEGRAKGSRGFVTIDDAIQQKSRTSHAAWSSEMLCERPSRSDCVYPEFDEDIHVVDCDLTAAREREVLQVGGMDFGYRNPTVMLWGYVENGVSVGDDAGKGGRLCIVDEHFGSLMTMEEHLLVMEAKGRVQPDWIGIDPAGYQRHESDGLSSAVRMKRAGYHLRSRRSDIAAGIEAVRRRMRGADGRVGLVVHPRCRRLIKALKQYHYPVDRPRSNEPVKDGADHGCDALRYLIVNLDGGGGKARCVDYF